MRHVSLTLWVLACWLAPGILMAQSTYYWADGQKVNLTSNQQAVIIHFATSDFDVPAVRSASTLPAVRELDVFPARQRAVVKFHSDRNETPADIIRMLGLQASQVRSVSYGWRIDQGFEFFHTHEVVLQLLPGHELSEVQDLMDRYGASFVRQDFETTILDVPNIDEAFLLANAIMERGFAKFAHPDIYAKLEHTNDPLFGQQFQMHNTGQTIDGFTGTNDADCNALEAWGITTGNSSITVAVIDDGVENHEDLDPTLAGYSPNGPNNGRPNSSGAHGQACAGIIAANHNGIGVQGVAPGVNLITANIFEGGETSQDLANSITWSKNQGADVLSNSWGYPNSCGANIPTLTSALNDANANGRGGLGCIVVFASGNQYQSCVDYPGSVASVIAVGAFGNDGIRSSYSNAGPSLDISAPSNDISSAGFLTGAGVRTVDRMGSSGYSSGNYTTSFGGTSAACPVVAGVAALVLSVDGTLTSAQVKNILYTTAKDFGASGFDNLYGNGAVDAFAAVQAAGGTGGGPGSSCSNTVSSFPYSESFESGTGAWSQASGDDLDWTRNSGGTPSSGTGPTSGSDGSFYMYIEASGNGTGFPTKDAYFESPCFDLTGLSSPEVSFDYHMLGTALGTLRLQASTDGSSWTTLWSITGSQGSSWQSQTVSLASYSTETELKLRFFGTTGSSWSSDIAVDNIAVAGGSGGGSGCPDTEVTLTLVLDNYPGETTWSLTDGGGATLASGGPYSTAGATVTETFCLADGCYDFTINDSYGDGICCAFGNGSYDLSDASGSLISGGSFTSTETQNFCVGGGGTPSCPAINFNNETITAYGSGQDAGSSAIQDGGATLFLQNNAWKDIAFNYTVTANTVVEFDFRSTIQGEIHGLGFDTDEAISSNLTFKVHGTQNWGITNYDTYSGSGWTTYTIPVGSFYTGSFTKLFFVADHDGGARNGNAYFRNVKVYESGACLSGASMATLQATPLQLGDEGEMVDFQVYPNPAREVLHILYGQPDQTYEAVVTDAAGRTLLKQTMAGGSQTLNLQDLSTGIYFLRVRSEAGVHSQKFVKE